MKRTFDVVASLAGLLLLGPILLIIALLVRLKLGAPVLFRQQRPGLHGVPFEIFKFRTMTDNCDEHGVLLSDTERLTPFGKFLRSTSMDELPELLNVLRGEMSLVGPRPLLMRYYPYFTPDEQVRFDVRPGITGLAQISGRNDLSWDNRIAADLLYVQKKSFLTDVRILFMTVWRVIFRQGLRVDPGVTMVDFDVERKQRLSGQQHK